MDKNSREYKNLKREMDNYLKNKEKERELNRINSLGFSRGVYPSEEYQEILRKRNAIRSGRRSKLIYLFVAVLIICALGMFLYLYKGY